MDWVEARVPMAERVWLAKDTACDLRFKGDEANVREALPAIPFDYLLQPLEGRRKKLLITDMDSTIITCECIDELADFVGKKKEVAEITERSMNGELDFAMALNARVALLEGLPESTLQQVYDERVRLMGGARALVQTMKASGAYTLLVSGGFTFFTGKVAEACGFHAHQGNRLEIRNGKLTGKVVPPILDKQAKLQALEDTILKLKISASEVVGAGDGANDLPMLLAADLGIAYHAKPTVRAAAKHAVNQMDLMALLYAQGYEEKDIIHN